MTDQGNIDWRRVHVARIAACCTRAAKDNNVAVEAPFSLLDTEVGEISFIALFPTIGTGRGTLVCLAEDWKTLEEIAARNNYCCAGLDPSQYSSYDASRWHGILSAWTQESAT